MDLFNVFPRHFNASARYLPVQNFLLYTLLKSSTTAFQGKITSLKPEEESVLSKKKKSREFREKVQGVECLLGNEDENNDKNVNKNNN